MPKFLGGYIHGLFKCKKQAENKTDLVPVEGSEQKILVIKTRESLKENNLLVPEYLPLNTSQVQFEFGSSDLLEMLSTRPRMLNISPRKKFLFLPPLFSYRYASRSGETNNLICLRGEEDVAKKKKTAYHKCKDLFPTCRRGPKHPQLRCKIDCNCFAMGRPPQSSKAIGFGKEGSLFGGERHQQTILLFLQKIRIFAHDCPPSQQPPTT